MVWTVKLYVIGGLTNAPIVFHYSIHPVTGPAESTRKSRCCIRLQTKMPLREASGLSEDAGGKDMNTDKWQSNTYAFLHLQPILEEQHERCDAILTEVQETDCTMGGHGLPAEKLQKTRRHSWVPKHTIPFKFHSISTPLHSTPVQLELIPSDLTINHW